MRGALVILLLSGPAFADNGPHKEGQYGGVTPGETAPAVDDRGLPPGGSAAEGRRGVSDRGARPTKAKRPPPRGTLTWVGFEAKDGGAEVFFQSVAPFQLTQRVEGTQLIVHLALSRLGANTWRQVDTRFFDNPLSGIVARPVGASRATKGRPARGAGIEARIAFKNAKDAREAAVRTATEPDGLYYAYLKFPEGTATPATAQPTGTAVAPAVSEPEADDAPPPPAAKPAKR
jgi:hypothetical protein